MHASECLFLCKIIPYINKLKNFFFNIKHVYDTIKNFNDLYV